MATVTGYTAAREQAIEDNTIVSGHVDGSNHLILTKNDASTVDAGYVKGDTGATGSTGATGPSGAITGEIKMFAGVAANVPSGYLVCDGSSQLRTTYAALFTAIGTTWGSADGTHFNLPNLVSKIPRGVSATPGTTGGSDTHTHSLSDAGAAALLFGSPSSILRGRQVSFNWTETHTIPTNGASTAVGGAVSGGIALVGSTDSGSTLPAYAGVLFIIKT